MLLINVIEYKWRLRVEDHYCDVIMDEMASQITTLTIVYSTVYSDADQRVHQSSASLASVGGIQRWPVNSPHKWPVTRKMFPFDDVIMYGGCDMNQFQNIEIASYVSGINDKQLRLKGISGQFNEKVNRDDISHWIVYSSIEKYFSEKCELFFP